jgi:hypothetical protein
MSAFQEKDKHNNPFSTAKMYSFPAAVLQSIALTLNYNILKSNLLFESTFNVNECYEKLTLYSFLLCVGDSC